jgi:predicted amidohydrolase YtcJ
MLNGVVRTLDDADRVYTAIAVQGERILALGDSESIERLAETATRVIDLQGRTVLPGLQDHHVHPMGAGSARTGCSIEQGAGLDRLRERVSECIAAAEPGEWIRGSQWDASALGRIPDAVMIDDISPDNPVILTDTSGHSVWVNSLAMKLAGIDASAASPAGGVIEKRPGGEPSGVLRESAIALLNGSAPGPDPETLSSGFAWALEEMASYGITAFTEAAVGYIAGIENEMSTVQRYAETRGMPLRGRFCLTWMPATGRKEPDVDALIENRNRWVADRLAVDCIKIFLDGVPTDSHTAAMLEPYADVVPGRTGDGGDRGMLLVPQAELNRAVARFDAAGLTVKFHAAGDAAVRAAIHAVRHARETNGRPGPSHDVGHVTFAAEGDFALAREVGATIEMSPYLWMPTPINESITEAIGEPRIGRAWAIRSALDAGALVIAGSDWAVVESVNPWIAIEAMITREAPGGSAETFHGKAQAISLDEALRIFTRNGARHLGRSHELGILAPGFLADLIVIDRDPWRIPVRELHAITVEATLVDGEIVYSRLQ